MPPKSKTKNHNTFDSPNYFTDISVPNMLYASIIRSPISNGTIRSVTYPSLPENYTLITAKEIAYSRTVNILSTEIPLLAYEKVSYKGEPIGIILGPDEETVVELSQKADIRFTSSFETNSDVVLTEDKFLYRRIVKYGESDSDYENAEIKTEQLYSSSLTTTISSGEVNGAIVIPQGNSLDVYCSTNWMFNVRECISSCTGIKQENISVYRTTTSDCGTSHIYITSILASLAAIAANITKRPVALYLTRKEQEQYINNQTNTSIRYRSAITKEGIISSMSISITIDSGAFNPLAAEIADRLVIACTGMYYPQNLYIEADVLRTPLPPMNTDFRRIETHAFFALESHLQYLSTLANITPEEIRLKNFVSPKSTKPFLIPNNHIRDILQETIKASDFNRKYASYVIRSREPLYNRSFEHITEPIRGIGLATAFNGNFYYGTALDSSKQSIELIMGIDGSLTIYGESVSASIQNIWTRLVSKELEIPEDMIKFLSPADIANTSSISSSLLGNVGIMTQLLRKSCNAIQKQRFRQPLPIKIKRTASVTQKNTWNSKTFSGSPFHDSSFGAAVVELELDKFTFQENIRGIWITIDAGEILDTKKAEQTVKSSVERVLSSLTDTTLTSDNIKILFTPGSGNPKQIHDLADNIIPGAYLASLSQALHNQITTLPVSQNVIYDKAFHSISIDKDTLNK